MPASISADRLSSLYELEVRYAGRTVGRIAQPSRRSPCVFEYDRSWIAEGFAVSPISLPLRPGVFTAPSGLPGALHGVFEDSLPDDWGRLLANRMFARAGVDPATVTPLARLAVVADDGMGALEYAPAVDLGVVSEDLSFDELLIQCQQLLDTDTAGALDTLFCKGGSSGGARPKAMVELDGDPWIVKFPISDDGLSSGEEEYRLALAAKSCGIEMPDVRLLPSRLCAGYFAVKRFDRVRDSGEAVRKVHMASAAALLEVSPFDETVDYRDLMRLSGALTGDVRNAEQLYLVMCFNVAVGNCDDHIRNFSFLFGERERRWRLSPAYDLTRNPGFFGEHSVLVNGKGSGIETEDLVAVGKAGGISPRRARELSRRVQEALSRMLQ